jgi:hypothetical protein
VEDRGIASCISALWPVPTGDQCPHPSSAWPLGLHVFLFSGNRWTKETGGLWKGSPTAWLFHSIFSSILSKSFVVCLFVLN